jgi:hypothetical protein
MLLWAIAIGGALAAVAAWVWARRLKRRLDALSQSYWELRYEFTRLRARVARLDPDAEQPATTERPPSDDVAFVPLSSLRKP